MTLLHVQLLLFIFDATKLVYGPSRGVGGELCFFKHSSAELRYLDGCAPTGSHHNVTCMRVPFFTQSCMLTPQCQHTCIKRLQKSMMTCLAESCNCKAALIIALHNVVRVR